jgi:hypothetical protein
MEYFYAFLIFAGIIAMTATLAGFFGLLVPIFYAVFGFILGVESIVLGTGGLVGSILNIYFANMYINKQGAMSNAPRYSILASYGFLVAFIAAVMLKHVFKIELSNINYWHLIITAFIVWIILSITLKFNRKQSLERLSESVLKYRIVEKYSEDPKWATYLYLKNGNECWNRTIPGSFLAKDPKKDLTFVHLTKEDALEHAQDIFTNAKYINE